MKLEVTCRQACFVEWCVQEIIHLNFNFDLQWISPVSERNRGSNELKISRQHDSGFLVDQWQKVDVTLWCWFEKSQQKHNWLVVQACGQALSRSAVYSANQHGEELEQVWPDLWSQHETIEADCCDKFRNVLSFISKLHCCNETPDNNWRGSKHARIESKFSWLSPSDVTLCFAVMLTNSSCVLVAMCQIRKFSLNDWSLASWQMGLRSSWSDKHVAQVKMGRCCDSAFECGICHLQRINFWSDVV